MTNWDHWKILAQGVQAWNSWRDANPDVQPDLAAVSSRHMGVDLEEATPEDTTESPVVTSHNVNLARANFSDAILDGQSLERANLAYADLRRARLSRCAWDGAVLERADFRGATLDNVRFQGANLRHANLEGVDLRHVNLNRANLAYARLAGATLSRGRLTAGTILIGADLSGADLRDAHLTEADLSGANLTGADLSGADLRNAVLVETNLERANLTGCRVYGTSTWKCNLREAIQVDLVISNVSEPTITVDNLEVAQFIYLLLNNDSLRRVIDTVTSKAVLILGRFTDERKKVLDAIRVSLRARNRLPIVFDFDKPAERTLAETVSILAPMCGVIIADLTDPKSVPHELQLVIPNLPSTIVQPIIHRSDAPYALFEHFTKYPWVRRVFRYENVADVIDHLQQTVLQSHPQE
jgi:uncharacterized protein YjbI with pentapeptide repeats